MPRKIKRVRKHFPSFRALLKNSLKLKLLLNVSAVLSGLALSVFFYIKMQEDLSGLQVLVKTQIPTFHVKIRATSLATEAQVSAYARERLTKKGRLTLFELSKALQREFSAERVSALAVDASNVYIDVTPRKAVLSLQENPEFKISDKGDIYKDIRVQGLSMTVAGLLPQDLRILDNGTVFLKDRRAHAAKTVIQLSELLKKEGFDYREIVYVEYRGFSLNKSETLPSAMIGDQDFEGRLARLRTILKKDMQRGALATHIELDYADKAFVQEKAIQ